MFSFAFRFTCRNVQVFSSDPVQTKVSANNGDVVLGYPNEEVAISMAKLYAGEIAKSGSSVLEEAEKIRKLLSYGSPEEIVEAFSKQPSTKVEGFATIAETTSHQACLRPAPESPAGNPDPADFDLH